jgi:histidyl-tRNA synthetase
MRDFLPEDASRLRCIETDARDTAKLYGFQEIITPIVEHRELLAAKSGEEIKARIYAFDDLGGRKVALRPEFTASIARLMATTLRNEPKPLRLFSTGTLYRYDEPQFGRYREFWQSNYEIMGSSRLEADVEILALTDHLLREVGLQKYWFKIGHVGILRGLLTEEGLEDEKQNRIMQLLDTKQWKKALDLTKEFGLSRKGEETLKKIFKTRGSDASKTLNPLEKELKNYPKSMEALENLQNIIDLCLEAHIEFKMSIETGFARGLEYYTGLIFELLVPEMNIALGGGGRYDKLVELFGGEPTPAVGVAHGLDRIALAVEMQNIQPESSPKTVAIIPIGDEAIPKAISLASKLRENGVKTEMEIMGRKVSTSLQDSSRRKVTHAIIIGPKEIKEEKVMLRDMTRHVQNLVNIEEVLEILSKSRIPV